MHYNTRRWMIGGLVAVAVLTLFFLPELVDLKQAVKPEQQAPAPAEQQAQPAAPEPQTDAAPGAASPLRPLEEVQLLIESGYVEELRAKRLASRPAVQNSPVNVPQNITWSDLKSKETVTELRSTRNKCYLLLKSLTPADEEARKALVTFINGLSFVLEGGDNVMGAPEALQYLQNLYLDTSRAFARPEVSRSSYLSWNEISLGSVLSSEATKNAQKTFQKAYDPQLTVLSVEGLRAGEAPKGMVTLQLAMAVKGTDTSHVEILKNGALVSKVPLAPQTDEQGRRVFYFYDQHAEGTYTFNAVDHAGNNQTKRYMFYPKLETYRKQASQKFQLPYQQGDPRVDRLFLVSNSAASRSVSFFDQGGMSYF